MQNKRKAVRRSKTPAGVLLLAVALTALAHGRALRVPFLWDDEQIFTPERIQSPQHLLACFRIASWQDPKTGRFSPYRPLRDVTHTSASLLLGLRPRTFHLVSLVYHAINIVLIFLLARTLTRNERVAWLAAAVFGSIPAHVEALTYAKNVAETQALCFGLASFLLALRALQSAGRRKACILASVLSYTAALLTKESAWPIPILLLAWILISRPRLSGKGRRRIGWVLAPLFLVAVFYAGFQIKLRDAGKRSRFVSKTTAIALSGRVELASRSVFVYLGSLAFPSWQAPWPSMQIPTTSGRATVAGGMVAILMLWFASRRKPLAVLSFGAWWVILALGPVANLVAGNTSRPIALQRLYTPSVGHALLLGMLFAGWPTTGLGRRLGTPGTHRRLNVLAATAVIAGLAICWTATGTWTTPLRFWRHATRTCPSTYQVHYNLGLTYARYGRDRLAVPAYERALQGRPRDVDSLYNLANALSRTGRFDQAEPRYRQALSLEPDHVGALNGLAGALAKAGKYEEAETVFLKARDLSPGSALANQGLVRLYNVTRRYALAARTARTAIGFRPNDAALHLGLGYALLKLGKRPEAVHSLERAVELGSGDPAQRLLDSLRDPVPIPRP